MSDPVAKVLVLSENRILRMAVEACLRREFDIIVFGDCESAINDLAVLAPDVVVMDLEQKNLSGLQVNAEWLKKNHPNVGAVLMVNFGDQFSEEDVLINATAALDLTLDCMQSALEQLHTAIRHMIEGQPEYVVVGYRLNLHPDRPRTPQLA
ncbi:MAG: response regulator [SAR202 cluster bacterium]|jgi:DNA-binding NarL/FixJ family response regulator|nr:response regulator [SAR202 cluster bacterium]